MLFTLLLYLIRHNVYVFLKFNVFAKESLHARPWRRKAVPFEFKKWLRNIPYFGGITWFLGEQKGGSEVTESQKGRPLKFLEGFRGETTQICLEDGVGSLQWNNIQRGDRLNFTVFSPKSSDPTPPSPQAIINDWSLKPIVLWRFRYLRRLVFVRSLCSSACAFYRIPRNAKTVTRAENILYFLFHFQRSNNAHYLRVIWIPQNNRHFET